MEKGDAKKRKAQVTLGTAASIMVMFGLFSLFSFASNITMPKHGTNPDANFTEQGMNWIHEVN